MATLKGPAMGPKGDRVAKGDPVPSSWPKWFIDELRAVDQIDESGDSTPKPKTGGSGAVRAATGRSARGRAAQ